MTHLFPHKSFVKAEATPGINVQWSALKNTYSPLPCTVPAEFGGASSGYTPEEFFAWAVLNSVIGTFKIYAEKKNIAFETIRGEVVATLDLDTTTNIASMSELELSFIIEGAKDKEQVRTTLEAAIKDCPVSNSIKSGKTYHIEIV